MTINFSCGLIKTLGLIAFLSASVSCVTINSKLGEDYIALDHQYDVYTKVFDIDDIEVNRADSLSSFSLYRFTIGAIREETFGLTTRSAAFTLVPVDDTLDFGKPGTQRFKNFHFLAVSDSISVVDESQARILQMINVYELDNTIDFNKTKPRLSWSQKRITDGVPVYNGGDSLVFNFSREFGQNYMNILQQDLDTITNYTAKFPGIYLSTEAPVGEGGRINMFKIPLNVIDGTIYGSYAILNFSAEYEDKGQVDTSFLFSLGMLDIYDLTEVQATSVSSNPQLAYNLSSSENRTVPGKAGETIIFEGGTGMKPVIKAASLREKIYNEMAQHGDPSAMVVNRATLIMPFEFPEDYTKINEYPSILSPTCRIVTDTTTMFAGLTDSSASDENQGDINRSLCNYAPDISHHIQEMVKLKDLSKIENYDIWLLAVKDEVLTEGKEGDKASNDMAEYLQQQAYAAYYQNMYGGYGYGGYSGYGGYGYGGYGGYGSNYYSNYYNLAMLSNYYSSANSGSSSTTVTQMDFHRFYKGVLNGPASSGKRPQIKVTYSVSRAEQ